MFIVEDKLDFHEFGPLREFDIMEKTRKFVEDAYVAGYDTILIITGVGYNSINGAKVRPLVEELLTNNPLIEKFKAAASEHGGRGAFQIWLKDKK